MVTQPKAVQRLIVRYLQMHVMDNVRQRIEAGHKDLVNEIRVCTLLFLGFPTLNVIPPPPSAPSAASQLHELPGLTLFPISTHN